MAPLTFNGPFHFNEINKSTGKIEKKGESWNLNKPGIYIWGFLYEYDKKNKSIGKPIDFIETKAEYLEDKMQFIPYYVGETGKGHATLLSRLHKHHRIINGDATKYTRLSKNYMQTFFTDNTFPIKYKRKKNNLDAIKHCTPNNSNIEYFNDKACLEKIYPNIQLISKGKPTDYPINLQNNGNIPDTLDDLINTKRNFWFCYSTDSENLPFSLETLETYTFWSLKGITISETMRCPIPNPDITIKYITNTRIFKEDMKENGRITPHNSFMGYLKDCSC
ncbi:MAG: hypothetical protein WCK34_00720 [Bacteroidota bacterium]